MITSAVVEDRDGIALLVDVDLDRIHALRISLPVVGRVDKNLIEDLVQTGYELDRAEIHALALRRY